MSIRVIADHPSVTIQIDETNDYRLFPFESVARGPSWYANGSPRPKRGAAQPVDPRALRARATLGQGAHGTDRRGLVGRLSRRGHARLARDVLHRSHTPLRAQIAAAARWVGDLQAHRSRFTLPAFPLLDDPLPGDNWTALQWWTALASAARSPSTARTPTATRASCRCAACAATAASRSATPRPARRSDLQRAQLRAGIEVALPQRNSARVLLIDPA
jgi:hypothetical protein